MALGGREAVCGAMLASREQTHAEESTARQGLSVGRPLGAEGAVLPPRPEGPADGSLSHCPSL